MWTFEPSFFLSLTRALGLGLCGACIAALALALRRAGPLPEPAFGDPFHRPRLRARKQRSFGPFESLLARLAGLVALLPLESQRAQLDRMLRLAGQPLGLRPDELLVLCALHGAGASLLGPFAVRAAGMHWSYALYVVTLGPLLPVLRLRTAVKSRAKELDRSLPAAIDLCVLCMGAGCDFPAALHFVVSDMGAAHRVCREELGRVLDDLALGAARIGALEALAERTASQGVREFVSAVCLSERKGTPLVDTLNIQAASLRQRRSVRAEELAAQAGVKMMLPMLLMVTSILLVIFGPFIVNGAGL